MSLEESNDTIAPIAVAAPVQEQTENEQPPVAKVATAVPAATAIPIASSNPDLDDESETNKLIDDESDEEKVDEKPENELTTQKTTQSPLPPPPHNLKKEYGYSTQPTTPRLPYPSFLFDNFLMLFILIGMIFILIGGILSGSAIIIKNINVYGASIITISLGLFTVSTFLILAALFRNDLNNYVRFGLLIIGAFSILGLVLYSTQSY